MRGPRHIVRRGKTPVLDPAEARQLIDAIDAAINPMPGIPQTLGGLVLHTYIDGTVVFDNGLTDQQAIILVPITMLVAAFGA